MKPLVFVLLVSLVAAQEIKRPTADTDTGTFGCAGTRSPSSAMPKAYDALGLATLSTLEGFGSNSAPGYEARTFSGWTAASSTYLALTLNVNTSSGGYANEGSGGQACVKYSIDGGISYTKIRCDSDFAGLGWSQVTDTIVLSATQDLTKVRVYMCAQGSKGNPINELDPGSDNIAAWDIWTSGTTTSQAPGSGSSAGHRRPILIVN